ncbi:hypothetical protein E3E36_09260 [Thermococcus sp. M36]|uniref:hypothetical protein n=1 Tax=Thermococcus sp. M36 TaxID=1638261 RepID=UPI00143BE4F6|nr:hypothetical protein [Thermococcus sp. M36]NJE06327.1 hypothetical protein [Thermococcus sp. M36]
METRKLVILIVVALGLAGMLFNYYIPHYQGGEIYEAANDAFHLLTQGFNVTVSVNTTEGKTVTGTLVSVQGSTIKINVKGKLFTVGGPSSTKEDLRARFIGVEYHGKVYVYELPPRQGPFREIINSITVDAYSERFTGMIYIEGNVSPIELGMLKYQADYMAYGSITINQIAPNGAIITANMVPIEYLKRYLGNHIAYVYGILYVNSDNRTLPLKIIEVRSG